MAEEEEKDMINLHGDLHLRIVEARALPHTALLTSHFRRCFSKNNKKMSTITSDTYVTLSIGGATVARTRVIPGSRNPAWNARFSLPLAHPTQHLLFQVKDNNMFGADLIGAVTFPAEKIITGDLIHDWFPIVGSNGKPPKPNSAIRLEMQYRPFNGNPAKFLDIKTEPDRFDVRRSYFPIKHGCQVTLYQDAHVPDGALPQVELDDGMVFKQGKCWEDICHAILEAHHLVYIVGWSIYHKVRLVREPSKPLPSGGDLMLGELLKYKSQEGVRVLLLVWDDKTSHNSLFIKTKGLMQTHDEETRKFFKHSSVMCVLSPRYASNKLSIFKQQVVGTLYTHHQKCVMVDTQAYGNKRKITAFIGGLDLCDGRYDTPDHRLFRDLDSVFEGDFHNPTFPSETKGPRQPWHDWHCKIEGPAAYDVLKNFEQRWKKARKWSEFGRKIKRRTHWHDDSLIKIERISWILSPSSSISKNDPALWVSKEDDPKNWHVQVFRSIDSGSLKGFPKDVHQAESQNLVYAKSLVIDRSTQTAYIQAIRAAQHFIYIENQYFLGSSYAWPKYKDAGADNIIPMELALKIASKIKAEERFAVYVIIPMWPEGIPSSASVQEILFWQGQTMQMMYEIVAEALNSMNMDGSHPKDYLNFYCLGNREEFPKENSDSSSHASIVDTVSASQRFGRFMIYVHSKGMIVDDEYVILGSANINERSMAGSRDTEIAMGAYQPHHTWTKKKRHPHGQVYGFRMSLWAEHLGKLDDCFKNPKSLPCVESVNRIADENWEKYNSEEFICLQGHILKYPIEVDKNGKVGPLPGQESFPDVGGKVLGSRTTLPDALTT